MSTKISITLTLEQVKNIVALHLTNKMPLVEKVESITYNLDYNDRDLSKTEYVTSIQVHLLVPDLV